MWSSIARFIIRYRFLLLILIAGFTVLMGYHAAKVQMTYSAPRVIPDDNPKYTDYLNFKKEFGEDGNVMVIGIQTDQLFTLKVFNAWGNLEEQIKQVDGIENVLSVNNAVVLEKDTTDRKMVPVSLFPDFVTSQKQLDSVKEKFLQQQFYKGLIYNPQTHAAIMAVRINSARVNSKERVATVQKIQEYGKNFQAEANTEVHYSGMPFIRTVLVTEIADEMYLFLGLAALITGLVLFILLRSLYAVIFSMLVVGISVIWTLGSIQLFGYEISILSGLIPPLVVVIAITNCVYLLNKYHIEFVKHGNKVKAMTRVIEKVGLATLFTNLTAAIGFGVFFFTRSQILKEFGLVAGLNIVGIFVNSIIIIPGVFSFLPAPKARQTGYLNYKSLNFILRYLNHLVHYHRKWIFLTTSVLVVAALIGCFQLKVTGFIVDDIPHNDKMYTDLKFFENNFHGVMPFEVLVDTKKKGGVLSPVRLNKIEELEDTVATFPEFSKPVSIVDGIKFISQSYFNGDTTAYRLPNELERGFIFSYLGNTRDSDRLLTSFIDSTKQTARISMSMADIGTSRMEDLMSQLTPKIYSILDTSKYNVNLTGSSILFLEGNKYIIKGLTQSLWLAFLLIAVCMGYLFRSWRMIIFSLVPNLIPLIITGGIMGYFHVPLKPSTVLVFSIAFGIAIDNAIRFLAKYQQELHRHNWDISKTVSVALYEAGISIIYTSIILFFGFIIFTLSNFGGTFYLGLLTSITLVVAMFNNLLLLPSLLLTLRNWMDRNKLKQQTPADEIDLLEEGEEVPEQILETTENLTEAQHVN